jgi:cytidylate kinase
MAIKVLVSWSAWAGKSSIIQCVVEKLGYDTLDIGQIFRAKAVAKWLTVGEYDKLVEKHPEEDIEIDNEFKTILQKNKKDSIVSWRMGFHFLPDELTIRLDVDPKEWARRIFLQNRGKQEKKYKDVQEAMQASQDRMERLQKRMLDVYGVDFMDKKNYKKIIKTDGKNIDETAQEIIDIIQTFKKNQQK